MTQDEINRKCETINKSSDKLKEIIKNCNNQKFYYLDQWEMFQANMFTKENKNIQETYHKYKRGTIVYVNFGTGIGDELSGYHFGIVLDKKDNPKKGTVTVIPLSSKEKKAYLSLDKEIVNIIFNDIGLKIKKLNEEISTIKQIIDDKEESFIKENDLYIKIKKDLIPSFLSDTNVWHEDGSNKVISLEEINNLIKSKSEKFDTLISHYQKNIKSSYALIGNITTISKNRIKKPINELDPIGRVCISPEALKKIEIEIIKTYTTQ